MKSSLRILLTSIVPLVVVWMLGVGEAGERGISTDMPVPTPSSAPTCKCGLLTVQFDSIVPGDAPILSSQTDADCFAWWEFVTLNWPTDSGAGFGDPGDTAPVQWETFMPSDMLFRPGALPPPPWGTQAELPPNCRSSSLLAAFARRHLRVIRATSKFASASGTTFALPNDIEQAAPTNAPNWLGAQNGTNIWYEVLVSEDEYNFIDTNELYNANQQAAWVDNGNGRAIVLPKGTNGGQVGSIELKAAWMEVTDPTNAKWNRYKISPAVVVDPATGNCRMVTVALVGLHIIHKTASQPTWIWATFEQVDNVPGAPNASGTYNFYNPNCTPRTMDVPTGCLPKDSTSPVTIGCTPNVPPPYYLGTGCPGASPIQVSRVVPIDATAQQVNATMQAAIRNLYPNSVWQYYQLVNVIWSTSPTQDPSKPVAVPMPLSGMLPTIPVANTTLETYAQNLTCTDCHRYATIAPTATDSTPVWDSDFSFALGTASYPPTKNRRR